MKLFVYGTLKRGFNNHFYLENSDFLGEVITQCPYKMVDFGPFPGLLDEPIAPVMGELYNINLETLPNIDALEGNGYFYQRKHINVLNENGEVVQTFCYFLIPGTEKGSQDVEINDEGYYEFT
jgi:gamma-glutamylaminecyclotransferase